MRSPQLRSLTAKSLTIGFLASGIILGGAVGLGTVPGASFIRATHAQTVQRPVGFAEIVPKIKPSVISARVKITGPVTLDDGNLDESPLERFFRRFGLPDDDQRLPLPR